MVRAEPTWVKNGVQDWNAQKEPIRITCSMYFFGRSYPGVTSNRLLALLTGVGVQALITFHTIGIFLSQHILLPKKGLFAVVAVVSLSHFHREPLNLEEGNTKRRRK